MFRALSTASASASRTCNRAIANAASKSRPFTASARTLNNDVTEGEAKIREILTTRFNPSVLKVQDVSGGCGSFYAIQLSSKEFKGLSTIKVHRMVNQELKDVIKGIHGLQLKTQAED